MMANSARLTMMPPSAPKLSTSETAGSDGRLCHQLKCAVPITEPTQKKIRVITMRALPPPTVNSVPEAQPPPSCMPRPNRKAPTTTEVPSGETKPETSCPHRLPAANTGKNSTTAIASISICARRPRPRRSVMNTRQAEVKPKAA